jgi:hypothetical protein
MIFFSIFSLTKKGKSVQRLPGRLLLHTMHALTNQQRGQSLERKPDRTPGLNLLNLNIHIFVSKQFSSLKTTTKKEAFHKYIVLYATY